ncbi:unnamed protein product [Pieris macdunnoughi]|uniref:Serpin domain-containing protein n=1 Tax=Pieris macdunnoughi TaxID=345717 RepID=A0A821MPT3_9NEOP|nr:unnamed protein product [Pieris macdunnoughi]
MELKFLLFVGATDKTLAELRGVLHLHSNSCFNNKFLEIVKIINSNSSSDVVVERSSIIFTDENLPIKNNFKNTIISKNVSDFQVLSFGNPEYAASVINNYVSEATHGSINEVVDPGNLDDIVMLAIDAISFKVSDFFQKADIEVNEEGTTASGVSGAGTFKSYPGEFKANRPFLYMIIDKQIEVPLFAGAYSKPSVY